MSSQINTPPIAGAIADADGNILNSFSQWFMQVFRICFDVQNSGPTANRPTKNLYPGKPYFDTSLAANGKPIWVRKDSAGWVDATGAAV